MAGKAWFDEGSASCGQCEAEAAAKRAAASEPGEVFHRAAGVDHPPLEGERTQTLAFSREVLLRVAHQQISPNRHRGQTKSQWCHVASPAIPASRPTARG
jgi:hypothetical protein